MGHEHTFPPSQTVALLILKVTAVCLSPAELSVILSYRAERTSRPRGDQTEIVHHPLLPTAVHCPSEETVQGKDISRGFAGGGVRTEERD